MEPTSARPASVSTATAQGSRPYQEDRVVHVRIDKKGWLLGVFDGHRGVFTAETASKALLPAFESSWQTAAGDVSAALRGTFATLTHLTHDDTSGATASVVFIPENFQHAYWAVLGDSPVAILDSKGGIHFGPDHNVRTNLEERAEAVERGGRYQGGYLEDPELPDVGLQMARSLGDADLSRVLSREPDISEVPLGSPSIALVGTDGILSRGDGAAITQLERLILMIQGGADAEALVRDALRRQTGDNVTAIVWRKDQGLG